MLTAPIPKDLTETALEGAALYPHRLSALQAWPRKAVVAEVGVASGTFTNQIFTIAEPRLFHAYDLFRLHELETLWGRPTSQLFNKMTQWDFYSNRFAEHISAGRFEMFRGNSSVELAKSPPAYYDVIYIDGDHSHAGVQKDTDAAIPALKADGLLVFNDYVLYDKKGNMYGVMPVVNDLCATGKWKVKYFALQRELFCDIALIRN